MMIEIWKEIIWLWCGLIESESLQVVEGEGEEKGKGKEEMDRESGHH